MNALEIACVFIGILVAGFVGFIWAQLWVGIHNWIENSYCRSFECAIANGLFAALTVILGSIIVLVTSFDFVIEILIEALK